MKKIKVTLEITKKDKSLEQKKLNEFFLKGKRLN